jgi:hypothetical protein
MDLRSQWKNMMSTAYSNAWCQFDDPERRLAEVAAKASSYWMTFNSVEAAMQDDFEAKMGGGEGCQVGAGEIGQAGLDGWVGP